ncbi:MAG: hypothetical protein Kow0029_09800 [Candidatus Rifleibacteriota bacterium]
MRIKRWAKAGRFWLCLVYAMILIFVSGCRQDPENPPKYYEAELKAMQREADRLEAQKNVKYLEDRYPWEGKKNRSLDCLPCRIYSSEKPIERELDYLHTFIHGKKRTKPRLRD